MSESEYESFLSANSNIVSKTKVVRSRVTKDRMVERHLRYVGAYQAGDERYKRKHLKRFKKILLVC